jgi:glycosyltransferase involved in cell wall biosynthesis
MAHPAPATDLAVPAAPAAVPGYFEAEDCFAPHRDTGSDLVIDGGSAAPPELTIAIPTFRRPDLLREAIASALAQRTGRPYEVIVVDNDTEPEGVAAVDDVVRSVRSPLLRLYRNSQNIGMFGNWNRCIELARAPWLSILNDDDLLQPDWLEAVAGPRSGQEMHACRVDLFGEQPWLSQRNRVDASLKALGDRLAGRAGEYRVTPADLLAGNPVYASLGVLMHRDAALGLGGYNERFWPIADYVFSARYGLRHGIRVTDRRLARYRFSRNESLKLATMSLSVKRCFEFRQALIRQFHVRGLRASLLEGVNRRQAAMDAYDWHRRSPDFDWRRVLADLGLPRPDAPPGRLVRAGVKLGWLAAKPLRSTQ